MFQGGSGAAAAGRGRCGLRPLQLVLLISVVVLASVGGFGYFVYRNRYPNRFADNSIATTSQQAQLQQAQSLPALCVDLNSLPRAQACSKANQKFMETNRAGEQLCVARAHASNYLWFWLALTRNHLVDNLMHAQLEGRWEENLVAIMTAISRVMACSGGVSGNSDLGCLFADAGANSGYLSLIAARNGMDTIAIEPLPTNFRILRYSLCMNQVNPITPGCDSDGSDCLTQPVPNPDFVSVFARFAGSAVAGSDSVTGVGDFRPGRIELLPFVISDARTTLEISGKSLDGHIANSYMHDELSDGRKEEMARKGKAVQAKNEKGTPTPAIRLDDWLLGADRSPSPSVSAHSHQQQKKKGGSGKGQIKKLTQTRRLVGGAGGVAVGPGVTTVRRVTILKIDTEGHEPSVIRGAGRLLEAGLIDHILLEYNLWRGMTVSEGLEMLHYLDGLGYVCYDLDYSMRTDGANPSIEFATKYPRVPRDEFEVMTSALHQDSASALAIDAGKGLKGYRGKQWAINLYFTKTLPPHKLIPGVTDDPVY